MRVPGTFEDKGASEFSWTRATDRRGVCVAGDKGRKKETGEKDLPISAKILVFCEGSLRRGFDPSQIKGVWNLTDG